MAYSSITSMSYVSSVNNSGNGVRARFTFEGVNNGKLDANDTWAVSLSNTDGPYTMLLNKSTSEQVEGVTAKILTSSAVSGNVSGTLELYPLTAGTTYTFQAFDSAYTPTFYFDFTPSIDDTPKTKNLASGTLTESISASATTLSVFVGNGSVSTIKAVWPDTPFYATLMPASPSAGVPNSLDSEIVKVTAVGNDQVGNTSLTVVRGQKGTTTKAFSEGDVVTNAIYAGDAVLLSEEGTSETETPWINAGDIIWSTIIDKIYPVGSIFMSATLSTPSDVANALGGTWVAWGAGRVPVGIDTTQTEFDTVEETGGEKTHTLTTNEMPSHKHNLEYGTNTSGSGVRATVASSNGPYYSGNPIVNSGGGQAHNNLQPYITCYMYKRTA